MTRELFELLLVRGNVQGRGCIFYSWKYLQHSFEIIRVFIGENNGVIITVRYIT